jgi:hypothetical protein
MTQPSMTLSWITLSAVLLPGFFPAGLGSAPRVEAERAAWARPIQGS